MTDAELEALKAKAEAAPRGRNLRKVETRFRVLRMYSTTQDTDPT